MNQNNVLKMLAQADAVITDSHIVYTSGKHGSAYINKDAIYPYTSKISFLCRQLAESFINDGIEVVVAPAVGGIIMSQWVANGLTLLTHKEILSVYAEKSDNGETFTLKRGYDKIVFGKEVLIVEDVLNTGGSVIKVIDTVRRAGGIVAGVGALCNRGGVTEKSLGGIPKLVSLVSITLDAWEAEKCPLCAKKVPINTQVGKGREFLENK